MGSTVRCPGGGDYVWNEAVGSMESTVFGCAAAPRDGVGLPKLLRELKGFDVGLTFEPLDERTSGLRVRTTMR